MSIFSLAKIPPIPSHLQSKFIQSLRDHFDDTIISNLIWVGCPLFTLFAISDFFLNSEYLYLALILRCGFIFCVILVFFFVRRKIFRIYFTFPYFFLIQYVSLSSNLLMILNSSYEKQLQLSFSLHLITAASFAIFPLSIGSIASSLLLLYSPIVLIVYAHGNSKDLIYQLLLMLGFSVVVFFNRYVRLKYFSSDFLSKAQLSLEAELGDKISQISHDLRSPLFALRTVVSNLNLTDVNQRLFKEATSRLIEQMGELTHHVSQLQVTKKLVDLSLFLEEVQEEIKFVFPFVEIEITKLEEQARLQILIDKIKLRRVILNLVGNAVKASKIQKFPNVKVEGFVDSSLTISVVDNGPGFSIKEEDLKKGMSGLESTGIGLQFCRNVLLEHSSSLKVARVNELTIVSFQLNLLKN